MQTNIRVLKLQVISSSISENDMFIFNTSKPLKATHKVGETVSLAPAKDVCLRPSQIIQGTHAGGVNKDFQLTNQQLLLPKLSRFTEVYPEVSHKIS